MLKLMISAQWSTISSIMPTQLSTERISWRCKQRFLQLFLWPHFHMGALSVGSGIAIMDTSLADVWQVPALMGQHSIK